MKKKSKRGRQAAATRLVQQRQGAAAEAARREAIGGEPGGDRASWGSSGAAGGASGAAVEPTASDAQIPRTNVVRRPEPADRAPTPGEIVQALADRINLLDWRTRLDPTSPYYRSPMGPIHAADAPFRVQPGRPCSTLGEPLLPRPARVAEDAS